MQNIGNKGFVYLQATKRRDNIVNTPFVDKGQLELWTLILTLY